MNTSVDVLEVMRKSANVASMNALDHGGSVLMNFADDCSAARAAVAELIEAADELIKHTSGCEALLRVAQTETLINAKSALARVKGA